LKIYNKTEQKANGIWESAFVLSKSFSKTVNKKSFIGIYWKIFG